MERQGRIIVVSVFITFSMIFLTGCTTENLQEAVNKVEQQIEYDAEENDSEGEIKNQESEQTPTEKELLEAADKENREAVDKDKRTADEETYRTLMEDVMKAIEEDDARALHDLQESKEGKALAASVRDGEHYIYFPDGGDSGKGIGYYTFAECSCKQWYYGDYKDGLREGKGVWYYVSNNTEDGSLYKEAYDGDWSGDVPNGKGRQVVVLGDKVDTNKKFKVKNGLFYGTYKIKDKLEDGTVVRGKYKLKKGKYVTISDEELTANNFEIPDGPHLAIAFLYDDDGVVRSCSMVYAEDVTKGVKHFYPSE